MGFIRRGTTDPNDFIDRAIRRQFESEPHEKHRSTQERLSGLFKKYELSEKLVELDLGNGEQAVSTPLLKREYLVGADTFNIEVGIGRTVDDTNPNLAVVLKVAEETHLLALPDNGVDIVPSTHGVPEFLNWLETTYNNVFPVNNPL